MRGLHGIVEQMKLRAIKQDYAAVASPIPASVYLQVGAGAITDNRDETNCLEVKSEVFVLRIVGYCIFAARNGSADDRRMLLTLLVGTPYVVGQTRNYRRQGFLARGTVLVSPISASTPTRHGGLLKVYSVDVADQHLIGDEIGQVVGHSCLLAPPG